MSEAHIGVHGCDAMRANGNGVARTAADWLYLAAAPTFAIMALLTRVSWRRPAGYAVLGRAGCLVAERNSR